MAPVIKEDYHYDSRTLRKPIKALEVSSGCQLLDALINNSIHLQEKWKLVPEFLKIKGKHCGFCQSSRYFIIHNFRTRTSAH